MEDLRCVHPLHLTTLILFDVPDLYRTIDSIITLTELRYILVFEGNMGLSIRSRLKCALQIPRPISVVTRHWPISTSCYCVAQIGHEFEAAHLSRHIVDEFGRSTESQGLAGETGHAVSVWENWNCSRNLSYSSSLPEFVIHSLFVTGIMPSS